MDQTNPTYITGLMLIGGELVESRDGQWLESINPADESALGRVPLGSAADMNAAVEAAEDMPGVQGIGHERKRNYIKGLIKLARQAGATSPTLVGNQLAVLYEGAAALSTSLDDPAPWTHAHKAATKLLDQAVRR